MTLDKQVNENVSVRKLLVLDASYSLETIRSCKLEDSVTCRDLDGFFKHVWTVHPFASLVTSRSWTKKYGKPQWHFLSASHTFVEGKMGRFSILSWLPPLNFLLAQVGLFIKLYRLIRKEKISVIRVGDPLYLGIFGLSLARLSKIPLVVRIGGNYDKIRKTTGLPMMPKVFFTTKFEKKVERFVLSRADLVAGANQDNLNFALRNGARQQFSTLFRYGNLVNKQHFVEPAKRPNNGNLLKIIGVEAHQFLLYIGRLESVKHPDHVVQVLSELKNRGNKVKAVLAGNGQCLQSLNELSKSLGVQEDIVLCGNKDQEWLAGVIPLAAVVISPHTGRALLEVALGEVPIVAYDIDWQSELIETGITGELVPYLDLKRMTDSAERFLKDQNYSRAVGKAVRERALSMMDPTVLNDHEREQYSILLNRRKK